LTGIFFSVDVAESVEPMLELLSRWLIQEPAHILLVAAVNVALWAACRATVLRTVPKSNLLWVPALAWLAYAGWEWLVLVKSPEANIRVDLLLIWPVIGLVTIWTFVRAAGGWWSVGRRSRCWRECASWQIAQHKAPSIAVRSWAPDPSHGARGRTQVGVGRHRGHVRRPRSR
jgi:hypothetical protein